MTVWARLLSRSRDSTKDRARSSRIAALASAIDPDPWRDRLRSLLNQTLREQRAELTKLAAGGNQLDTQPAANLTALADQLYTLDQYRLAVEVLERAWHRFPNDYRVNFSLGLCCGAFGDIDRAVAHSAAAVGLLPGTGAALTLLGLNLQRQGRLEDAARALREAIRVAPSSVTARHWELGEILEARGDIDGALAVYREGARIEAQQEASDYEIIRNFAVFLKSHGLPDETAAIFEEVLKRDPNRLPARLGLAFALDTQGKRELALAQVEEAARRAPDSFDAHIDVGESWERLGRRELAITELAKATKLNPGGAVSHRRLADALSGSGEYDEAEREYLQALRIEPDDAKIREKFGNMLRSQKRPDGRTRVDEAVAQYREWVRLRPDDAWAFRLLAEVLRESGETEDSLPHFRKSLQLNPKDAGTHRLFAEALDASNDMEAAMFEYREAARVDAENGHISGALWALRNKLRSLNRPDETLAIGRRALEQSKRLKPNDPSVYYELAKSLGAAGFPDQAKAEYDVALSRLGEAIRREPGNVPVRQRLAELLKETGKPDLAVAEYREMVRLSPANLPAHLDLADKLREAGDRESAIALCRAVAEREPGNERAHYSLALALRDSGQTDQAIIEYRAAIGCNPHDINTHFWLASLLEKRGDLEGAIVEYRATAILDELGANLAGWAIGRLETLLKQLGRPDETVHHFRVIVAKVPDDPEARARLAVALERQGQKEEAASEFREARRLLTKSADGQIPIEGARAYEMLGGFLKSHGMLEQALVAYREAARLAPENAGPKNEVAWLLLDLGRFQDALDQITIAVRAHGDTAWIWSNRGAMMARLRRWREARDDFNRAIEMNPADHFLWFHALTVDLWLRDHESYGRRCRALLERFESTTDPVIAERVSKVCLLGSPPSDIRARAVHLAERSAAANAEKWKEAWHCASRALVAYRAGDRDDAVKWALATPDGSWYGPGMIAELVIAMTVYREGRPDEARLWLELARVRLETHLPAVEEIALPNNWHDILHFRLLLRESEQLIGTGSGLGEGKGDDQASPKQVRFFAELARGYSLLGVALQERREYERAEKAFRRAKRLAPGDAGVAQKLERTVADWKAQARRLEEAIGRLPAMPRGRRRPTGAGAVLFRGRPARRGGRALDRGFCSRSQDGRVAQAALP